MPVIEKEVLHHVVADLANQDTSSLLSLMSNDGSHLIGKTDRFNILQQVMQENRTEANQSQRLMQAKVDEFLQKDRLLPTEPNRQLEAQKIADQHLVKIIPQLQLTNAGDVKVTDSDNNLLYREHHDYQSQENYVLIGNRRFDIPVGG